MKYLKFIFGSLLLMLGAGTACTHEPDVSPDGSSLNSEVGITDENKTAVDQALALFPGTVKEVELELEEGQRTWKIDISGAGGSEVEVYLLESSGELVRVDGEKGPFTYDFNPGAPLITFSEAKSRSDSELSDSLESWRLRREDSYRNKWVYQFSYSEKEVVIDAEDGAVLDIKG